MSSLLTIPFNKIRSEGNFSKQHPTHTTMNHLVKILPALAALIITAGCAKKSQPVALNEQKTILYAEFMHEVNSFNPLITYERDFKADHLFFGNDVIESAKAEGNQLAGFRTKDIQP